jgi:3-oxoacyl-[acyl-carrier-protein] synthase-3
MTGRPVYLKHLSHYLPDRVLDNAFFEQILDTDDAWIREKTGIAERRHMADYRGALPVHEIGRRAVDQLVASTGYELARADLLLAAACTDDLQYPGAANLLSEHYGLRVPAFQMNNACSSVVYALEVCRGLLQLGRYRDILVVTGEPFTLQADYGDRRSSILFGDASTAMVLSSESGTFEIEGVSVGGRGARVIHATAPGARPCARIDDVLAGTVPARAGHDAPGWGCFAQEGRAVVDFVMDTMPAEIESFLASTGRSIGDIDWFIGHQSNLVMLEALCQKLGVPADKHLHNVERIGNVSSAGWVTVLSEELEAGCFAPGDRVLVSAFGGGLAWGSALLRKL